MRRAMGMAAMLVRFAGMANVWRVTLRDVRRPTLNWLLSIELKPARFAVGSPRICFASCRG